MFVLSYVLWREFFDILAQLNTDNNSFYALLVYCCPKNVNYMKECESLDKYDRYEGLLA